MAVTRSSFAYVGVCVCVCVCVCDRWPISGYGTSCRNTTLPVPATEIRAAKSPLPAATRRYPLLPAVNQPSIKRALLEQPQLKIHQ